jgi:hypothetical protein
MKPTEQIEQMSKEELTPIWTTTMLYSAIDWWQRKGSFNKELYEKIVQIKYNLEINTK